MYKIDSLDLSKDQNIQAIIDNKTKPPGALGKLESLAMQLARITGPEKINLNNPTMLVFAGDHGIAKEGVSIAPSEVTQQMVMNFLSGGAAINCFCRTNNMKLEVIDAGILSQIDHPNLIQQALGGGTGNFSKVPAMSLALVDKGIEFGAKVVNRHVGTGCNIFAFGEMGIGNTSSASVLLSALTGLPVETVVGRGTGVSDSVYQLKIELINKALDLHHSQLTDTKGILATLGGYEIVQMVGAMLAAAEKKCVLMIDGFIASVAAMVAWKLEPKVIEYMVFCHQSEEMGHIKLMEQMQVSPLLNLGMRLGEGTGAALAMPLLRAAESFYNDMASFEAAGVTEV